MPELGRPPAKKTFVQRELRDAIVSGSLAPGSRVPTRRDLSATFSATLKTVQDALSDLEHDGFIVSRGTRGTFVTETPPHLNHVALVFPHLPTHPIWGLYWDHLVQVAKEIVREQGLRLTIYTGINELQRGKDYERLLADLRNDRLAGIIFSVSPHPVEGTEILDRPGVPRVAIAGGWSRDSLLGVVQMDMDSFVAKAVAHLVAQGAGSVALLQHSRYDATRMLDALEGAGIACPYQYQHGVDLRYPKWARNITRVLFDRGQSQRPDALIVLDDNLCASAVAGLRDAGQRVPDDLHVLSYSNFPWNESLEMPVMRLGFDMNELLRTSLAELDHQRAGKAPRMHQISALFEAEFMARPAALAALPAL